MFPQCSGYHVRFTRARAPVRSWVGTTVASLALLGMLLSNVCDINDTLLTITRENVNTDVSVVQWLSRAPHTRKVPSSILGRNKFPIVRKYRHYFLLSLFFLRKSKLPHYFAAQSFSIIQGFPQCSGYHVRLTRARSSVRSWAETLTPRSSLLPKHKCIFSFEIHSNALYT